MPLGPGRVRGGRPFAGLPPGHEFFAQYSFIDSDELPEVQALVSRVSLDRLDELKPEERTRLLALPFVLIERRHRLDLIDDHMKARILRARHDFAEKLPDDLRDEIEFFDAERYNAAATIQDNILFGKLVYGQAQGEAKVRELITEVVDELNLRDEIIFVGLNFDAGIAGSRLSAAQRQKVAIGRCLLKQPDLMIINYRDGLRACVLSLNYAVLEWAAAWSDEEDQIQSTVFWTQELRPFMHFSWLLMEIEKMMHTGQPPWPVEHGQ